MDNLIFAEAFADRAHRGQVRKGGDVPYIKHPREVSGLLRQHYVGAAFEPLHVAGLLHDVVEDTKIGIETIEVLFGPEVAELVWAVTNTRPHFAFTADLPDDALRLKAADLFANVTETQRDIEAGHFVWPRFATGRGKVDAWDRQTRVIERGLGLAPTAYDFDRALPANRLDRLRQDRDLVERLRARVDTMKGLVTIVTDAERDAMAERDAPAIPAGLAPPVHLKG